jgi:hypothetical protein
VSIIGISSEWADLIDPIVPQILKLVITTWEEMPSTAPDDKEDNITFALCRALKKNRTARGLMFNIYTQLVELEPAAGEEMGRQDIVFVPVLGREDIYFCLESKRLNVVKDGKLRTYASEYVTLGMLRFVTGQYSKAVRHGGMLGYVLDGNVAGAVDNVRGNIQTHHVALRMAPPGELQLSTILISEPRARETHHQRTHGTSLFRIHHLFMAASGTGAY